MPTKKPIVRKKNGNKQRSDVVLTKEIASVLVNKILNGEALFDETGASGEIELTLLNKKMSALSRSTLNNWVKNRNTIPETGEVLRDVLDSARDEYKARQRKERQKSILELAEQKIERTLGLDTREPIVAMFGVLKDEAGNILKKENTSLLKVQMDTAKFAAERLDSATYGRVDRSENKHLIFSLSDLRKRNESDR